MEADILAPSEMQEILAARQAYLEEEERLVRQANTEESEAAESASNGSDAEVHSSQSEEEEEQQEEEKEPAWKWSAPGSTGVESEGPHTSASVRPSDGRSSNGATHSGSSNNASSNPAKSSTPNGMYIFFWLCMAHNSLPRSKCAQQCLHLQLVVVNRQLQHSSNHLSEGLCNDHAIKHSTDCSQGVCTHLNICALTVATVTACTFMYV